MTSQLLSATYPEIWNEALHYPGGLHAVNITGEKLSLLVIKLPHSYLLTARMNKGFKIYVVPLEEKGFTTVGLMTAFFDDSDSPLVVWSPICEDLASQTLIKALLSGALTIRLFDEHNRELLGYVSELEIPLKARKRLEDARLHPFLSHETAHRWEEVAYQWFGLCNAEDDEDAISVHFKSTLFSEDRVFKDERPEMYEFHGAKGFSEVSLVKLEPGQFQEIDIILLLQRVFKPNQIYHAPKRHYDNEEIADAIVITDSVCLIVQAKDSPNSEKTLKNSLERKRLKSHKHLDAGCLQIGGAINYLYRTQPLVMKIGGMDKVVDLGKRNILTLIVVRELFISEYASYSTRLMQLHEQIDFPCIALDYQELIQYSAFCDSESAFINAYFQVFNFALSNNGIFPRLRFGVRDLLNEDGSFKFGR